MSLRHALLGLLADQPGSGWDLLKRFEASLAFVWPATQSQLYTELGRMADDGLVTVVATGARNRKEYEITGSGRTELGRWLVDTEPERIRRSESILRVFFLWAIDAEAAAGFLRREADVYRAVRERLEDIERHAPWDDRDFDRFARIALENGLRVSAANEGWAQWAAEQVSPAQTSPSARPPSSTSASAATTRRRGRDEPPAG
jgi:PadR family transcriptional regulator AphA